MSNQKIRPPATLNSSLSQKLKGHNSKIRVEFKYSSLKQDKVTFVPNNVASLSIVFELDRWSQYFTLKDCFFGAVKLTKNVDPDKNSYSRNGIVFDSRSLFSVPNFDGCKNVIFGV